MALDQNNIFALDLETTCDVTECDGFVYDPKGQKKGLCDHALNQYKSRITQIGVWSPTVSRVFTTVESFKAWNKPNYKYLTHGGKFDFKQLAARGLDIREQWHADTNYMAVADPNKIPPKWLDQYNDQRAIENKKLPPYHEHRKGNEHSLKTLAPYHLDVPAFWEGLGHDSEEYVLLDCQYTYQLWKVLTARLKRGGYYKFYSERLFPWVRDVLLPAEMEGVRLDLDLLEQKSAEALPKAAAAKAILDGAWADGYKAWHKQQVEEIKAEVKAMKQRAWDRLLEKSKTPEKKRKHEERFATKFADKKAKIEPLSIDSPKQLLWLLKDHYGYDVGDILNADEEGTGKDILNQLAAQGHDDIKALLDYRHWYKLNTTYYPNYKAMAYNGRIYAQFNPDIARTGRLSSSGPNLQNVPGEIHDLMIAGPGRKMICRDESGVEARLIAYYTGDPILYDVIMNSDFHSHNAKVFFGLTCDVSEVKKLYPKHRKAAKTVGFALFYGAGWRRIKKAFYQAGFSFSDAECRAMLRRFQDEYEISFKFKKEVVDPMLESGQIIKNLFGRPIYFPRKGDVYMRGFNRLIQSSASDLVLHSAYKANQEYKRLGLDAKVVLLVHDEIVVNAAALHAAQADRILDEVMTTYDLTNQVGRITLETGGAVADVWLK